MWVTVEDEEHGKLAKSLITYFDIIIIELGCIPRYFKFLIYYLKKHESESVNKDEKSLSEDVANTNRDDIVVQCINIVKKDIYNVTMKSLRNHLNTIKLSQLESVTRFYDYLFDCVLGYQNLSQYDSEILDLSIFYINDQYCYIANGTIVSAILDFLKLEEKFILKEEYNLTSNEDEIKLF